MERNLCVRVSGGCQTGVPEHFPDHGLRGLLQVPPLGETAGKDVSPHTVYLRLTCAVKSTISKVSLAENDLILTLYEISKVILQP